MVQYKVVHVIFKGTFKKGGSALSNAEKKKKMSTEKGLGRAQPGGHGEPARQ